MTIFPELFYTVARKLTTELTHSLHGHLYVIYTNILFQILTEILGYVSRQFSPEVLFYHHKLHGFWIHSAADKLMVGSGDGVGVSRSADVENPVRKDFFDFVGLSE